jgi:HSP20 family protein
MATLAKIVEVNSQPESSMLLNVVVPADLFKRADEITKKIARRAFELFEDNGRTPGRDLDDWFKAEAEMLQPIRIDLAEANGNMTLRAEVPGFTAKELEVTVEPQRVTITGKRETKEEHKDKKTVYTETSSNEVLRVIGLPASVNAEKAAATLKDGVLELEIPKAVPPKEIEISKKV